MYGRYVIIDTINVLVTIYSNEQYKICIIKNVNITIYNSTKSQLVRLSRSRFDIGLSLRLERACRMLSDDVTIHVIRRHLAPCLGSRGLPCDVCRVTTGARGMTSRHRYMHDVTTCFA